MSEASPSSTCTMDGNSDHKRNIACKSFLCQRIKSYHSIPSNDGSCFTDHSDVATVMEDAWHCDFDDVIKRTDSLLLNDGSVGCDSGEHCAAFSNSGSPIPRTSKLAGPGFFSSPILESPCHLSGVLGVAASRKHKILRHRRFGSSSIVQSVHPNFSKITKFRKISPKLRLIQTCKKNCKIFSTCVTPCPSPTMLSQSDVFRVSGITMSPSTPISWKTQSPLERDSMCSLSSLVRRNSTGSTPTQLSAKHSTSTSSSPGKSSKSSSQRLQVSDDSCAPDKFYFWNDDWSELVAEEKLGHGGFGQVFEGKYRGKKVAIKKLKTAFEQQKGSFENFVGEIMSLRLSHPNLVRSLVLVQPPNSPLTPSSKDTSYLVMELAGERNLLQVINEGGDISLMKKIQYNIDILHGLAYLHNHGIAHLDLKPGNVVVTSDDVCKICDFGSCKLVEACNLSNEAFAFSSLNQSVCSSSSSSTGECKTSGSNASGHQRITPSLLMGTLFYRAPELLKGLDPSLKSDIYSFGIMSWQIKQRSNPYPNLHPHTAVYLIVVNQRRPAIPDFNDSMDEISMRYYRMLEKTWSDQHAERPTVYEILKELHSMMHSLV